MGVLSAMASGVKVNDDCVEKYNQLKLSKDIRFVIFKITDGNDEIVVEQTGAKVTPPTPTLWASSRPTTAATPCSTLSTSRRVACATRSCSSCGRRTLPSSSARC